MNGKLCHVMLCYVILCYVMLCHVMLCYVMLCYVMLYHVKYRAVRNKCYIMDKEHRKHDFKLEIFTSSLICRIQDQQCAIRISGQRHIQDPVCSHSPKYQKNVSYY
jgi:hypothetical protein